MLPRTIDWVDDRIEVVDQTVLPSVRVLALGTLDELVSAIRRLVVRGAPALGVAGALGVALAARGPGASEPELLAGAERLAQARPTAANLGGPAAAGRS